MSLFSKLRDHWSDPLYRNSYYLWAKTNASDYRFLPAGQRKYSSSTFISLPMMANSVIGSVLGFVFDAQIPETKVGSNEPPRSKLRGIW